MIYKHAGRLMAILMMAALMAGCGLTDKEESDGTKTSGFTITESPR